MAHMMGELGTLTTGVERLRAWVEEGAGAPPEDADLSSNSRSAGWIVGALLAANGTDILHARREPAGLEQLLEKVRALLSKSEMGLAHPLKKLARVEGEPNDWEIPWAISNALFLLGSEGCALTLEWTFERDATGYTLWAKRPMGEALLAFIEDLSSKRPGVNLRCGGGECMLHLDHGPQSAP